MKLDLTPAFRLETPEGVVSARHFAAPWGVTTTNGMVLAGVSPLAQHGRIPVRMQSSCLFSEAFGTVDCDCAMQLRASLEVIASGNGLLVYSYQEGRGAGLEVKARSIAFQQAHLVDTATAFRALGFAAELRDFSVEAAVIEALLGQAAPIDLLTNNIEKVNSLLGHGFLDVARRPLIVRRESVEAYLREKREVLGHMIDDE